MKQFAVFDIDGTIARTSLFLTTVHEMIKRGMIDPKHQQNLQTAQLKWQHRKTTGAFEAYERTAIAIIHQELTNIKVSAYNSILDTVIDSAIEETYRYPVKLIKQLKAKGYLILAISGSETQSVARFCQRHGFDDWIGSDYHSDGVYFTGVVSNAAAKKAEHLDDLIKKHKLSLKGSVAIGDTESDINMLKLVEQPICFNPNQQLKKQAMRAGWPIVVERKNVIYELKPQAGSFVLKS